MQKTGTLSVKERRVLVIIVVLASIACVFILIMCLRKLFFKIKIEIEVDKGIRKSETMIDYFSRRGMHDGPNEEEKEEIKEERGFGANAEKHAQEMKEINNRVRLETIKEIRKEHK